MSTNKLSNNKWPKDCGWDQSYEKLSFATASSIGFFFSFTSNYYKTIFSEYVSWLIYTWSHFLISGNPIVLPVQMKRWLGRVGKWGRKAIISITWQLVEQDQENNVLTRTGNMDTPFPSNLRWDWTRAPPHHSYGRYHGFRLHLGL